MALHFKQGWQCLTSCRGVAKDHKEQQRVVLWSKLKIQTLESRWTQETQTQEIWNALAVSSSDACSAVGCAHSVRQGPWTCSSNPQDYACAWRDQMKTEDIILFLALPSSVCVTALKKVSLRVVCSMWITLKVLAISRLPLWNDTIMKISNTFLGTSKILYLATQLFILSKHGNLYPLDSFPSSSWHKQAPARNRSLATPVCSSRTWSPHSIGEGGKNMSALY